MIKNVLVAGSLALAILGCGGKRDVSDGRYQGVIELEQRELGFEMAGRVVAVGVRAGDEVVAGQELARLDDGIQAAGRAVRVREADSARADLALVQAGSRGEDIRAAEAELAAARATEAAAGKEVDRDRNLYASGAIAPAQVDDAEARLARATGERQVLDARVSLLRRGARKEEIARSEARVAALQEAVTAEDSRLDRYTLRAPLAGTVLDVYLEPGETAGAGVPVLALVDRTRPYADVFVPIAFVPQVQIGAAAAITVEGMAPLAGTVEQVFARAEFTPRYVFSPRERPNLVIRVRIRIDDPGGQVHAGLPAFVALAVPRSAGEGPPAPAASAGSQP